MATIDGHDYEIDVEQAMAAPVTVADGKASVRVSGYYERASVGMGNKLVDDPQRPVNPAVPLPHAATSVSGRFNCTRDAASSM